MLLEALMFLAPLVELEWDAPASCPSSSAFEESVQAQADVSTEQGAPAVLRARVVIRERGAGLWELSLSMERDGETEARSFEAESCEAVAEVAATLVSLRVVAWVESAPLVPEPDVSRSEEPTPRRAAEREAPMPEVPSGLEPSQLQAPLGQASLAEESSLEIRGWLAILGGAALGVAPGVGGAVALEGGLEARWWRAGLAVQGVPRRFQPHPEDSDVRGRFDLLTAEALGCVVPWAGPVEFPICGRIAAGGIRATADGDVAQAEPGWGAWWGVGGSGAATWYLTEWLAPAVSVEALAPPRDRSFSVGSVPGSLHQTGVVAVRAWAGIEIHL